MTFNLSQPVSLSMLLILSTNVKNNFINRGISTIISSNSLDKKPLNPMWITGLTDGFVYHIYL